MFIVVKRKMLVIVFLILLTMIFLGIAVKNKSFFVSKNLNSVIVIDPGHGGDDGGCIGIDGTLEKDINLEISKKLADIFSDNGYNVVMIRSDDSDLCDESKKTVKARKNSDLKKRVEIINNSNCALLISVHCNQYSDSKIFGSQVFYTQNDTVSEGFAKNVMAELKKLDEKNKRVAKELPNKNYIFSNIKTPGILVECGFLSNSEECERLKNDDYREKIARAIYNGAIKNSKNIK